MNIRNLSPFLMLDHFHVTQGAGFPDHPHRGQATITYMLEGSSRHEDSAGHKGLIEKGGVQWMIAGRGIMHAEMPVHENGAPDPRGLQLWVDLPKQYKMVEPSYQELGPNEIPTADPNGDGSVTVKVISGKTGLVESPVRPLGGCWLFHVIFNKNGTSRYFQEIPVGWAAFVYVISGSIEIGKGSLMNEEFHALILTSHESENGVMMTGFDGTEVILAAGERLDQEIFQYGPFVMTSRDEIMQTLQDYQEATNGFESARKWSSEIARGHI